MKLQNDAWKTPLVFWVVLGATSILLAYAFLDTIRNMVHVWNVKEEYGYAYLVPVITLFLIWQRKNQLAEMEFRPSVSGLLLMLFGGFLFFLGAIATTHTLSQYGMVVVILGIALSLLGWRVFKIIMVPLALLFFMVPFPPFIYQGLSGKLQLISSNLGVEVIQLFGISVYQEGNVIDMGTFKLQVVEACSGLRYLFPLATLSFLAAYLFSVELWKKVVLFLSSIPITILMNSFRIGVIGVLVEYGGVEQAEGFLHYFEGWIIFMACIALLIGEMAILVRIGSNRKTLGEAFAIEFPEDIPADAYKGVRPVKPASWLVVIVAAGITVSGLYVQMRESIIPDRKVFAEFPLSVKGWKGRTRILEPNIIRSLKAEDYIMSDFANDDGSVINFYVAYYADQAAGEAAHSPRACIPGGGWLISDLSVISLPGVSFGEQDLKVNRLIIKKGDYTQLVYYAFLQRGRNITNEYLVKWYLFWDALTRNRTDGALLRMTVFVPPGEDVQKAEERLLGFAMDITPALNDYVPD